MSMRPYIICHMTISIDGKVTGSFLGREECVPATEEYYRLNRAIQGRGAFRRFKDKICYEGIEQQWYDFQNNAYREFALRWCKENNIRCEMDE